jgi:hypothetical protein
MRSGKNVIMRKGNSNTEMPNQFKSAQGSDWFTSQPKSDLDRDSIGATTADRNSAAAFVFQRTYAPHHLRLSGSTWIGCKLTRCRLTRYYSFRIDGRHFIWPGSDSPTWFYCPRIIIFISKFTVANWCQYFYGSNPNSPNSQLTRATQRPPSSITDLADRFSVASAITPRRRIQSHWKKRSRSF